jgi:hypothetical protein
MLTIQFSSPSLEDLAYALAEGEHDLGDDVTAAGYALIQWPGADCPWFVPHPQHLGADLAS